MYQYEISGTYFECGERKYFREEVWAQDNTVAMEIALGKIMWNSSKHFNNAMVKLENIHYECM